MTSHSISQGLKKFIKEHIHSVFGLEVLLLLHRTQPRSFTPEEVASELGIGIDVAQEQLSALASADLVVAPDRVSSIYCYHPADKEVVSLVHELAAAYSRQRVPILSLILAEHPDRIRSFAEAFRLIESSGK